MTSLVVISREQAVFEYHAPLRDMQFNLHEVFQISSRFADLDLNDELSEELINSVLEEAGKIAETLMAPLNQRGDELGCQFDNGQVRTPDGFADAYRIYAAGGWIGLSGDPQYGGQGMPKVLTVAIEEMTMAANSSLALTAGGALAIARHASESLKETYLPRLYDGSWSATMCLTEAQAGTDLSMLKTRAEPDGDAYRISGSKMFITGGEHDLTENIVHLVLAKLPDAPPGAKGVSLFLVPKFLPESPGQSNGVSCGSIEHKMGLLGSATCVMNFDSAKGFLVGEPHNGLACMFTMMNYERLTIGLQGLALGDASYQVAARYAEERRQGRSARGAQSPEEAGDSLLVHADVRRMLLTMRANSEAARALAVYVGSQLDIAHYHPDEAARKKAEWRVAVLTPVAKAAFSDRGFEACVLGQQVLGGHGYVREWGQEQKVRDARIAQIYEGTNGIQALDLMGRKVVYDRQGMLDDLISEIESYIDELTEPNKAFAEGLRAALSDLKQAVEHVRTASAERPDEVGASSVPFLDLMSIVMYGYMWARMMVAAQSRLDDGSGESNFYQAKVHVGEFYLRRCMPRTGALRKEIEAGSDCLMSMPAAFF